MRVHPHGFPARNHPGLLEPRTEDFSTRSLKCALKLGLSTLDDDKIK
jgi:hypothetical protein